MCLSDQVLTGAIAGAVSVALAFIAWKRATDRQVKRPVKAKRDANDNDAAAG